MSEVTAPLFFLTGRIPPPPPLLLRGVHPSKTSRKLNDPACFSFPFPLPSCRSWPQLLPLLCSTIETTAGSPSFPSHVAYPLLNRVRALFFLELRSFLMVSFLSNNSWSANVDPPYGVSPFFGMYLSEAPRAYMQAGEGLPCINTRRTEFLVSRLPFPTHLHTALLALMSPRHTGPSIQRQARKLMPLPIPRGYSTPSCWVQGSSFPLERLPAFTPFVFCPRPPLANRGKLSFIKPIRPF